MTSDFDRFVFVALPGQSEYVVAGRFRASATPEGVPLGEFVYGRSYLGRPDAVGLDPVQLKLTEGVRETRSFDGVFGVIRDAMPSSWGRLIRDPGSAEGVSNEHLWDGPGALAFAPGLEPPRPKRRFNTMGDLPRLLASADAAPASPDAHQEAAATRTHEFPVNRRLKTFVEDSNTLWIAKFQQEYTVWNHARVRHATLQLARDCGLDPIPSRIERINGSDILMVKRGDREWMGDGYTCSRAISGLTLLSARDTPSERRRWSYLVLADQLRRTSSHPRTDLRELFGRICFNAAISNLNDHLGLPMMLAQENGWRLAPATGLAPTPRTDDARGEFVMICGPEGRTPSRENIVGGAGRFLLSRVEAEGIFDRIAGTVRSSWHAVMRRSGVSAEDCELVARSIVREGDD